ncbi:hypothetical protein LA080_002797 [Diaporthe eres]|nr:hypothetical protein LA080_002797 [Diaporthe eres]
MSRERTRGLDPAIDKTRPGRTEVGGSHAIAQAAPGNLDAVPLGCPSWPFGGPASYPAAGCAAYDFLHDAPAEPQLSTPSQMGEVLVRLELGPMKRDHIATGGGKGSEIERSVFGHDFDWLDRTPNSSDL